MVHTLVGDENYVENPVMVLRGEMLTLSLQRAFFNRGMVRSQIVSCGFVKNHFSSVVIRSAIFTVLSPWASRFLYILYLDMLGVSTFFFF